MVIIIQQAIFIGDAIGSLLVTNDDSDINISILIQFARTMRYGYGCLSCFLLLIPAIMLIILTI